MTAIVSTVDTASREFRTNETAMRDLIEELQQRRTKAAQAEQRER